jgi:primosomal replication protein N
VAAENRLTLDATLATRDALRYTPAGLAALDCMLRHASQQVEAGTARRVECELAAVAFGDVAKALAGVAPGSTLRCEGFLARRWRTGISVALHITRYTELKGNDHAPPHRKRQREGQQG